MNRFKQGMHVFGLCLVFFFVASDCNAQSKPSRPSSSTSSSKPKYGPSKPSSQPAAKPATSQPAKPKYGPSSGNSSPSNSQRPVSTDGPSDKARAAAQARSQQKFLATKSATQPPVTKYTSSSGKDVHVRTATADAQKIRSQHSESLKPEVRQKNINVHVAEHHYHHDYNWYRSQPVVHVGGGYSSAFWWMMMTEWSAERRAQWLYNHRYEIEADAYRRGLQDAQTAQYVAKLEAQRSYRDPNYVDRDFEKDPSLMYEDEYVHVLYNAPVETTIDPGAALTVFLVLGSIVLLGVTAWGIYFVVFKVRWGS